MDDRERMKKLRQRRVRGARLLQQGIAQAEVARRVGVSRQTVMVWERKLQAEGFGKLAELGVRAARGSSPTSSSPSSRSC